ncbi:LptF/LptG family permease [Campylobacter sp. MG1]|uniref:LptF/LptG family permease n=1 Tax=Campylobacter sp. MG1 TaxID=2976332 RepID=UPI00226CCE36|nr:LptF/LptG family permease [Campylobacter sp. MG1]
MNKVYFRYLFSLYFKNCFVFTIAFIMFYLMIDIFVNYNKLNLNTNIFLLYIFFTIFTAFYYVLPITQILSIIYTKITLIKKNEFIAFYSLGLSKNASLIPAFIVSILFSIIAIFFNYTNLSYSEKYKSNILKYGYVNSKKNDLFFRYNNDYIYIGNYSDNKINDIEILKIKNNEIATLTTAKEGNFVNNNWVLKDVKSIEYKFSDNFNDIVVIEENINEKITLNNFKPEILDNLDSDENSLQDVFFYLKNFDSNQNIFRANIYKQTIFLLFAPFLSLIIFYKLPIMPRFSDLNLIGLIYTFISLLFYGSLFLLLRFAQNGVINPEISILLPIFLIIIYSLIMFVKNR